MDFFVFFKNFLMVSPTLLGSSAPDWVRHLHEYFWWSSNSLAPKTSNVLFEKLNIRNIFLQAPIPSDIGSCISQKTLICKFFFMMVPQFFLFSEHFVDIMNFKIIFFLLKIAYKLKKNEKECSKSPFFLLKSNESLFLLHCVCFPYFN